MEIREDLQAYLKFLKQRKIRYQTDEVLEVIDDIDVLTDYSRNHGVKLGIVYQSKYHLFVVDLVREKSGELSPRERLVKAVAGNSVVIVPFREKRIILLRQFRHSLGDYQYCFPRGFGEPDISPEENARKEVMEELNSDSFDYTFLGHIVADSGVCGEMVNVYQCRVTAPTVIAGYEDITSFMEVSEAELFDMIASGQINDGFTLSAAMLMRCHSNLYPETSILY